MVKLLAHHQKLNEIYIDLDEIYTLTVFLPLIVLTLLLKNHNQVSLRCNFDFFIYSIYKVIHKRLFSRLHICRLD